MSDHRIVCAMSDSGNEFCARVSEKDSEVLSQFDLECVLRYRASKAGVRLVGPMIDYGYEDGKAAQPAGEKP